MSAVIGVTQNKVVVETRILPTLKRKLPPWWAEGLILKILVIFFFNSWKRIRGINVE